MPDDSARTQAIESRIDRGITGQLAVTGGGGGAMSIAPRNMGEMMEFAKLMSVSGDCVRPAFRGNPGACLGVAMQAFRCGGDPFAWANRAYVTRNTKTGETQIAYEASLIDAQVNTSGILSRRLRLAYDGHGPTRKCIVSGWIKGEGDEPFLYESPMVKDIAVQNSPLWRSDPDQQLGYYSKRAWARRWVPEVLLGIYTTDEIDGQIIDVTADRIDAHAAALQPAQQQTVEWRVADHTGDDYAFRSVESAIEAFRKILITSAAIGPQALEAAWENNEALMDDLGQDPQRYLVQTDELVSLYEMLTPHQQHSSDGPTPPTKGEDTAGSPGKEMPADTPTEDTHTERARSSTAERAAHNGDVAGSTPAAPTETQATTGTPAESPPAASSGEDQAPAAATFQQSGERHDPFWDRDSLRIEPPTGRTGKPDLTKWTALLYPRIRQAWSAPLLDELRTANADLIDAYASNFGSRARAELNAEFEQAREKVNA